MIEAKGTVLNRREFLRLAGIGGACAAASSPFLSGRLGRLLTGAGVAEAAGASPLARNAPEARYYVSTLAPAGVCASCHGDASDLDVSYRHTSRAVKCFLCANECDIPDGARGLCRARENVGGVLKTLVYGRPAAIHVDPIEKKPFYHFLPGTTAFSIGTAGCPLRCEFCQNWELSSAAPEEIEGEEVTPGAIVRAALRRGAPTIAFTYNEPTVFFEYLADISREGRKEGLRHVLVSSGYMNPEPLEEMCGFLDAIKIDLKGYDEEFYRKVCGGELGPVLRSIRGAARRGVHLEIVNLVVPTLNDSPERLRELCRWVAGETGPDTPVHFTRFHPDYRMLNLPPTPVSTLERAWEIAREEGLRYPYVGNVPDHPGNNTYCPSCGGKAIERIGFHTIGVRVDEEGRCAACGAPIAGVWK
ncbi:MAG: AmmeMemoRadiSam system radical SAM enzyme [Candidatus Eisenbacteria bacterium]|nr:AmmeMemoRadiSam system radical SAM enzyme [Candidatus Eisenbacteria bacterium]